VDGEVSGPVNDFGISLVGANAAFGVGNPDTTITTTSAINDGAWHHVTATRDATSGQMNLYLDGSLQASTAGPLGTRTSPPDLRIGSVQTEVAGGFLTGAIDDVQIFDRVFSAAEVPSLMNHAPVLTPVAATNILAGRTLVVTNIASDVDQPAQTLTFSLLNPPAGATILATNGLLQWRPDMVQAGATYPLTLQVADNGTPAMTATQSFFVTVMPPAPPVLDAPQISGGRFTMQVNGDAGPDYQIYVTTNLAAGAAGWSWLMTTSPLVLPFQFVDPATNYTQRFYRVLLGP
jgi:hypothetical protein